MRHPKPGGSGSALCAARGREVGRSRGNLPLAQSDVGVAGVLGFWGLGLRGGGSGVSGFRGLGLWVWDPWSGKA